MKKLSAIILFCFIIATTGLVMATDIENVEIAEPFSGEEVLEIEIPMPEETEEDYSFKGEITDESEFESELNDIVKTDGNNNIMLFDKELDIKGEAKDLIMAAGGKVVSKALGSYAFLAANELNVSGEIFNDTFAVGNDIQVEGNIGRDLYILGNTIDITGNVARDVYAGGETLSITGTVNGDVRFAGGSVFISSNAIINGNLYLSTDVIEIREGATINGVIEYPSTADEVSIPSNIKTVIRKVDKEETPIQSNRFFDAVKSFLWWTISNCILFAIAMSICPKLFESIKKIYSHDTVEKFCKSAGWGILSIIVIPVISILALFTFIGSAIGVIGLILYTLGYMIATIIVGYALSNAFIDNTTNKFLKGFLGILIIEVLRRLPVIGWLVALIVNAIAFGTVIKLFKESRNSKDNVIEVEKNEE